MGLNEKWAPTSRYQVFVGLNDSSTKTQQFQTEKFQKVLCNVCKAYHIAFSVNELHGGYFHEDGSFVSENSLCLTLIGTEDDIVEEIARDVCTFFNQESVMVIRDKADHCFIHGVFSE